MGASPPSPPVTLSFANVCASPPREATNFRRVCRGLAGHRELGSTGGGTGGVELRVEGHRCAPTRRAPERPKHWEALVLLAVVLIPAVSSAQGGSRCDYRPGALQLASARAHRGRRRLKEALDSARLADAIGGGRSGTGRCHAPNRISAPHPQIYSPAIGQWHFPPARASVRLRSSPSWEPAAWVRSTARPTRSWGAMSP